MLDVVCDFVAGRFVMNTSHIGVEVVDRHGAQQAVRDVLMAPLFDAIRIALGQVCSPHAFVRPGRCAVLDRTSRISR